MRTHSYRNTLTVAAVLLVIAVAMLPHIFLFFRSMASPAVVSTPSKPLVATSSDQVALQCQVGPYSFQLPDGMCQNPTVQRQHESCSLRFTDGKRIALVNLTPLEDSHWFDVSRFPAKKNLTHSELYREIAAAQSSDFSFAMSRSAVRWQAWLLNNRKMLPSIESIEYVDWPEFDGNLHLYSATAQTFEWATKDGKWKGTIVFHSDELDWVRRTSASFELVGDPGEFDFSIDEHCLELLSVKPMQLGSP